MKAAHTTPDAIARNVKSQRRNISVTATPHKQTPKLISPLSMAMALVNGGTFLQKRIDVVRLYSTRKTNRSNSTAKKKSVSCDCNLLGFGSCVRSMVMTVNVKPARRDSVLTRFDLCLM